MRARDQNHELNKERSVRNVGGNPRFLDRIFGLLEGPVATSLVKLLATGIISITIVAIVAILAFTSAPISLTLSAIGLGVSQCRDRLDLCEMVEDSECRRSDQSKIPQKHRRQAL
ncbi:hypothetical protein N9Z79_09720 [Akkermansiaceae bacterium]|nr:hypothetical protein [Akkermansiaceae bacterium]MDB4384355.1 hypothetical protein [Akkermansiaceae bacterium]